MSLIADGLLIVAGLTAGLYCFVLSRRLKAFASTETGIGQEIRQLNATLAETREALAETQSKAKAEAEALARDIAQARKLSTQLTNVIAEAERAWETTAALPDALAGRPKSKAAEPIGVPVDEQPETAADATQAVEHALEALDEEIEAGEVSFEDALSGGTGEAQLGFLPDAEAEDLAEEDGAGEPDEDLAEADVSDEEDAADIDLEPEGPPTDEDHAPAGIPAAAEAAENLLKVERMAL